MLLSFIKSILTPKTNAPRLSHRFTQKTTERRSQTTERRSQVITGETTAQIIPGADCYIVRIYWEGGRGAVVVPVVDGPNGKDGHEDAYRRAVNVSKRFNGENPGWLKSPNVYVPSPF